MSKKFIILLSGIVALIVAYSLVTKNTSEELNQKNDQVQDSVGRGYKDQAENTKEIIVEIVEEKEMPPKDMTQDKADEDRMMPPKDMAQGEEAPMPPKDMTQGEEAPMPPKDMVSDDATAN